MSFADFRNQVNEARAGSEGERVRLKTARKKVVNLRRRKERLLREIGKDEREESERLAEIERAESAFAEALSTSKRDYADALRAEWSALTELAHFTNPVENVAFLNDHYPILLFPLRLETRFKKVEVDGERVDELWVRIFPDEIAVDSFESDLSETEIRNARSYWLARWQAGQEEAGKRAAWRALASAHGPGRAYWLIKESETGEDNYIPRNLDEEPTKGKGEIILAIGTEEPLTGEELEAIVDYWEAVWLANGDRTRIEEAGEALQSRVAGERAAELVDNYRPANLNDPPPPGRTREETEVRVEFVIFPETEALEAKLHAWSQPPRVRILPERFVFLAFNDGEPAISPQLGELVPPELILGPDPAAQQGEELRLATAEDAEGDPDIDEGDLIFAQRLRWLFDFEEAVANGMGFKIRLTAEQAENGFDRVFVLGVKLGADQKKGQELLEELFEQHHYSRKGMALLRQGTPTNNTEEDGAGYSWRHDPDDSYDVYFDDTAEEDDPTGWFSKRDGRWLAEMLGIDPAKLQPVENYYNTDIAEAKAMQRALWPATMGHFMDSMMNPVFSQEVIEQTRHFFTRYVSGRGNLPAIRVGRQPYGILPATTYTQMEWLLKPVEGPFIVGGIHQANIAFQMYLYRILLDIDQTWTALRRQVAHVGKEGDPHQLLLDIVGLHPDSVEVYKRYANSIKQVHNIYNIFGFGHGGFFDYYPDSYAAAAALLARYGYRIGPDNPEPEIFKKSFFEEAWVLRGDRIDRVPNSEEEPIGSYTEAGDNYIRWLIDAARESHDRLRQQKGFIDARPPTALLYLLLHHALDLSYIDTSLKLYLSRGVLTRNQVQRAYVEPDFIHVEAERPTESRWTHVYAREPAITEDETLTVGEYIPLHLELPEAAAFNDVLAGLEQLEKVPTARLERLLMEHIDTVSYRYDAWLLGYLHMQLEYMRGLDDEGEPEGEEGVSPPERGIYLGAYGWLEEVRPEHKILTPAPVPGDLRDVFDPEDGLVEDETNDGYILAPSQNHAVTAAVLRNGHLSNDDPEEKEELKIKLSSERVRLALQIIEGIQGGQSLAALLGYQFERGLHDRTDAEVDEFIFELRNAFPLAAKKFKETAPGPEDPEYESIEQIEARNVMDGVAFLEHIEETVTRTYPFDLSLPAATDGQRAAINQEVLKLIEVNDAVADLALAESVHQVVLGNYERASATLDTYSKGHFPPTPDVIKTPRSGTQITHRVALQFDPAASYALADPGVTPRMVAEPAIHDWLTRILPAMAQIECVAGYVDRDGISREEGVNLEEIGLAHIDLLYLLDIDSEQAMSALDDLVVQRVLGEYLPRLDEPIQIAYTRTEDPAKFNVFEISSLVASLRALLLRARALNAADVKVANEAAKEDEHTLTLDWKRVDGVLAGLEQLRTNRLAPFLTHLESAMTAANVTAELDGLVAELAAIFGEAGRYGLPQTGTGFLYQWQQATYGRLREKVEALLDRWQERRVEYVLLRDAYLAASGSAPDEELFAILQQAELKVSDTPTVPLPPTPADYFALIESTKFGPFEDMLDNRLVPLLALHTLSPLLQALQMLAGELPPFGIRGVEVEDELKQVRLLADDLKVHAQNLEREMTGRKTKAEAFLKDADDTGEPPAKVALVQKAAKAIFGDDFVMVPTFTVPEKQGTEWQNALADAEQSLRYLLNDLAIDFPLDDWLYGVSRVREKLYHLENALIHVEGFTGATLALVPAQFPFREDDYWLGMQFPEKKPGTEEPFTIDEDKLLFTGIYPETFNPAGSHCGLLLDEWTEVIPARAETVGLTFHYDQPNSEPPQALLLALPGAMNGSWEWEHLVNTLHETLELAKKRAVEPDHVDDTTYARFLPPIVSLSSPLPLTATLNLALNNDVRFLQVFDNE